MCDILKLQSIMIAQCSSSYRPQQHNHTISLILIENVYVCDLSETLYHQWFMDAYHIIYAEVWKRENIVGLTNRLHNQQRRKSYALK